MSVSALIGVSLTVADLGTAAAFFRDALGLPPGSETRVDDPARVRLLGLAPGTTIRTVDIAAGRQAITLSAFDLPGRPYPPAPASNDPWFEHVALVCGDIDVVHARIAAHQTGIITTGGPVRLPPNTGRVTAFKFRDPEGHPLELIAFPKGVGAPVWHALPGEGILGFDHTAIAVTDLDRSLAFYEGLLGFTVGGRSLNRGPEQDRLDGLQGCAVDVVALEPAEVAVPHVELLHYRTPAGRPASGPVKASDVASVRQIHRTDDLDALTGRLAAAGTDFVSDGIVTLADGRRAAAVRDPDGHMIVLTG